MDSFTRAYIEAALWSSLDDEEPMDLHYGPGDLAPETLTKMQEDCAKFQRENACDLTDENCHWKGCAMSEYAGHDFWLTRCGHGCGFWDGDWDKEAGQRLTYACRAYGEVNLYLGDDGKIYA